MKQRLLPIESAAYRIGMNAGDLRKLCDGDDLDADGVMLGGQYFVTDWSVEKLRARREQKTEVQP